MAIETVNETPGNSGDERHTPRRPSLKVVAHAQNNELFDVRALIKAMLDAPEIQTHNHLERLAWMADEKLGEIQRELAPYI
jgi:hypothetical protein